MLLSVSCPVNRPGSAFAVTLDTGPASYSDRFRVGKCFGCKFLAVRGPAVQSPFPEMARGAGFLATIRSHSHRQRGRMRTALAELGKQPHQFLFHDGGLQF